MSTRLNQILAVEKTVKPRVYSQISELHNVVQKPTLFDGFNRTYQPIDSDGEAYPPESQRVQFVAKEVLDSVVKLMSEAFTLAARKDWTNTKASGNIVVDGKILVADVPATYLLYMEKQLTDLHTMVKSLPLLDPAIAWLFDPNSGLYRSDEIKTHKTKKIEKALVLFPATPEHPAQVKTTTEDVLTGHWNQVKLSGAMPKRDRNGIVERIEMLINAVKVAREQANIMEEVPSPEIAKPLFNYIFGD